MEQLPPQPGLHGAELTQLASSFELLAFMLGDTRQALADGSCSMMLLLVTMTTHARLVEQLVSYEPGDWLETLSRAPRRVIPLAQQYLLDASPFDPDEVSLLMRRRGGGMSLADGQRENLSPEAAFVLEQAERYREWLLADGEGEQEAGTAGPSTSERSARVFAVLGWLLTKL